MQQAGSPRKFSAALQHHRQGDFDTARSGYLTALTNGMTDARLPYLLTCLEIHSDDLESAKAWFRWGVRRDIAADRPPPPAAIHIPPALNAALLVDPKPVAICRRLSLNLSTRVEPRPSMVALKAWLAFAPKDTAALETFADAADHLGEYALAAALLQRAFRLDPDNAVWPFKRGNALNKQGEPHQALASYEEAVRIDRGMCTAHVNAAATLQRIGRTEAAEQRLRKVLENHPRHPEALFTLAEILFRDGRPREAVKYYTETVTVDPVHTIAWLHQAHAWKQMGLTRKAAQAYRQAAALLPDRPDIHFNLGATLHGLKDFKGAEEALARAEALDPEDPSTGYLLRAVRQETVSHAPRAYVERLFDRYAASFDRHMKGILQYRIPGYLRRHLKPRAKERGGFDQALDVGCGTGLAGETLRDLVGHMTGVDIAGNILECAARKALYDQLVQDDFQHFLADVSERYDLIVAADVFIYTGDLDPVLVLIRERLSPSGCVVFSIEKATEGAFHLQRSGRFAHSRDYIIRLADKHGFNIETARPVPVRMENHKWVGGLLFVMTAG